MSGRGLFVGILIPVLIFALSITGLAAPVASATTSVTVNILGDVSLTIKNDGGSHDFGIVPGCTFPDLTRIVTLATRCNLSWYTISIQASPVLRDLAPTAEVLLSNFTYSGPTLTSTGPLSTAPAVIVNNGARTAGIEHPVSLRFWNLDGNELPGTYTTTVTFTIMTP